MINIDGLMAEIKIRKFEDKDLKKVLEIEKASFKYPYSEDLLRYLSQTEPEGFLIAESQRKVIGYAIASLKEGHLISIAVAPEWRRKEIGTCLLLQELRLLKSKGCSLVKLEVRKSNIPSQKFFQKHGFEKIGEIKSYYQDGEDAIIYQKKLF